jgi:N-acetylmuramoyl-L-alanine amidase
MPVYFFHKSFKRVVGLLSFSFAVFWALSGTLVQAEDIGHASTNTVIFIDPGHGGKDTGARGANNLHEKDVVLALAKLMITDFVGKGDLILSRNDDYSVDLFRRTESANNRKAHLFISLHTGGSFRYTAEGITVYYFLDSPGRLLPEDSTSRQAFNLDSGRIPWHGVQYRHASESRLLARFIQTALAVEVGSANCKLRGAPLLMLSAANMPAVLVEVGNLNNPAEESKLGDPEYLASLAEAIGKGVDNYLNKTVDISSTDLHE